MKNASLIFILTALLFSGCSTVYVVRHTTVDEILEEGQAVRLKRYRIEGYVVNAFEHQALYGSLDDAKESKIEKSIWLRSGISSSVDPFGRTREILKVTIEGTVWMKPDLPTGSVPLDSTRLGLGVGHMGAFQAELVDVIVIEQTTLSTEPKVELPTESTVRAVD